MAEVIMKIPRALCTKCEKYGTLISTYVFSFKMRFPLPKHQICINRWMQILGIVLEGKKRSHSRITQPDPGTISGKLVQLFVINNGTSLPEIVPGWVRAALVECVLMLL